VAATRLPGSLPRPGLCATATVDPKNVQPERFGRPIESRNPVLTTTYGVALWQ
jgi:hypothetical protein